MIATKRNFLEVLCRVVGPCAHGFSRNLLVFLAWKSCDRAIERRPFDVLIGFSDGSICSNRWKQYLHELRIPKNVFSIASVFSELNNQLVVGGAGDSYRDQECGVQRWPIRTNAGANPFPCCEDGEQLPNRRARPCCAQKRQKDDPGSGPWLKQSNLPICPSWGSDRPRIAPLDRGAEPQGPRSLFQEDPARRERAKPNLPMEGGRRGEPVPECSLAPR